MPPPACRYCGDTVYDGEGPLGGDGLPVVDHDVHMWCYHIQLALQLCLQGMETRRAQGLPTPTSALFVDPHKPSN